MKIMNVKNIDSFCKMIDSCEGRVSLVTEDGSRFNLKSKLSQFVALSHYLGKDHETIDELEIESENAKDMAKIINYMMCAA